MRALLRDTEAGTLSAAAVSAFVAISGAIGPNYRAAISGVAAPSELLRVALDWVDEDVSLVVETLCATTALKFESSDNEALRRLAPVVARKSVEEASYRASVAILQSVGARPVLAKWNTSNGVGTPLSGLPLRCSGSTTRHEGAKWLLQSLYAVAASAAMAFAFFATVEASLHAKRDLSSTRCLSFSPTP